MPSRYDPNTKAKAIRLVREHRGDYPAEYAAITAIAGRVGMTPETLRKRLRQAEVDEGTAPGTSTVESAQVRELEQVRYSRRPRVFSRGSTTRDRADLPFHRREGGRLHTDPRSRGARSRLLEAHSRAPTWTASTGPRPPASAGKARPGCSTAWPATCSHGGSHHRRAW